MDLFLISIAVFLIASLLSTLFRKEAERRALACLGVAAGSIVGLIPSLRVLKDGIFLGATWPGSLPGLKLALGIDRLSAFFTVAIFGLSLLVAVYAWGYLKGQSRLHKSIPFFPLLVAAMAVVVTARDGFFFLIGWEIMSLASFFLVISEHQVREVRHAGWIYLIATHLATAFLIAFFVLLCKKAGSFSFDDFARIGSLSSSLAGTLFIFAVIGFGTKAGIFPFHVWLPHAHPAAPSYISALMSGVMIKTGIYGILRSLTFLGAPPLWWGGVLITLGILSAVLGVLYALMQHDLKRLLAYHSVENIGIIVTGIGLGLIGMTWHQPIITTLGFGGALFHVWNHAIFKGLLFLGAGHVVHATHTREIDRLGGLFKSMPVVGTTFLLASAAICGLPPFNGFVSEWLLYLGLFHGAQSFSHFSLFVSIAGIVGIAFAGALAVACFTKVFGVIFLGEPRSELGKAAHEASISLLFPMAVLAFLCLAIGLYPQAVWPYTQSVLEGFIPHSNLLPLEGTTLALANISGFFFFFTGLLLFLLLIYRALVWRKKIRRTVTWDCAYPAPTPRMQYTASSFAEPLQYFFSPILKPHVQFKKPLGYFPVVEKFEEHTEDLAERTLFAPLFAKTAHLFAWVKGLQRSRVQNYLALIFVTLILLLLGEVWFGL